MSERNGATGLFSSVRAAIAQWCIPMNSCPPRAASLMKCISPGCVCVSVASRSRVGRWGAGRKELFGEDDVDVMEGTSSKRKTWNAACFPYKNITLPSQSRRAEFRRGKQRSTAEQGEGVREGDSRMAGLCGFVKGYKVCSSTKELHRNPNSLQLNERSLIHW